MTLHTSCIEDLNLFERTLIKFCLPCLTVVRLGQISKSNRQQSEVSVALKGRIAYLPPLEVDTNASLVPDVLNADGLVVLVGGQPNKNNKVRTTVVDFRKVHAALTWLRQINRLYKDVLAYSVEELK